MRIGGAESMRRFIKPMVARTSFQFPSNEFRLNRADADLPHLWCCDVIRASQESDRLGRAQLAIHRHSKRNVRTVGSSKLGVEEEGRSYENPP
jgi:hypothetical protein